MNGGSTVEKGPPARAPEPGVQLQTPCRAKILPTTPRTQLLGLKISASGIDALLSSVDKDGTGEVELGEFTEMMSEHLAALAAAGAADPTEPSDASEPGPGSTGVGYLSLDAVAVGYRRAKLLQALQEQGTAVPSSAGASGWRGASRAQA